MAQPTARVAAMVVSDMNDRLSPTHQPPTIRAAIIGWLSPVWAAIPFAMGTRATIVPTLVPMASDTKHDVRKSPASRALAGTMLRVKFTVASMEPISLAEPANAPAIRKIHTMSMIFQCPALSENTFTR